MQLFAAELSSANLERLALAIARIAYPHLEPEPYLSQLDEMAQIARPRVDAAPAGEARAMALVLALRDDLGLRGNTAQYYEVANSYLNVVLERSTGLPIMLCLVLVAIGRRLGLSVEGAGYPNHFMVRYEDAQGVWILDPFHGVVMEPDDVEVYFSKLFGQATVLLEVEKYAPVSTQAWALRILNNLRVVYMNGGDLPMLGKVLDLMLIVEPDHAELWQERGVVGYRSGEFEHAARALRRYFFLKRYVPLGSPDAPFPVAPPLPDRIEQHLWNLLEEIETAKMRWN